MKSRDVIAILFTLAVAVAATNVHLVQAAESQAAEGKKAPVSSRDIESQWTLFQKSAPGRYCFFHREKDVPNSHNSHVFVSITGDTFTLEQGGILRPDNKTFFYTEDLSGSRQGDKIVATFTKSKASTEFSIGNGTLTNSHFMAKDMAKDKDTVTYVFEPCED
jgi:hypothetical protein